MHDGYKLTRLLTESQLTHNFFCLQIVERVCVCVCVCAYQIGQSNCSDGPVKFFARFIKTLSLTPVVFKRLTLL